MHSVARLVAGSLLLSLAACAPTYYTRSGASVADFERDKAQCDYETSLATTNQGHGLGYRTVVGESAAHILTKLDLIKKCLIARGWQETAAPVTASREDQRAGLPEAFRFLCQQRGAPDLEACVAAELRARNLD